MQIFKLHKNVKIRLIEILTSNVVYWTIAPFLTIYFSIHFGSKITGILLIINVIVGTLSSFIGGYLGDQFGRKIVLLSTELVKCLSYLIMALANSYFYEPIITFVMSVIITSCWSLSGPSSQAMVIDVTNHKDRKFVFTLSYWMTNLSISIGSIIGSIFFKNYFFHLLIAITICTFLNTLLINFFIEETYTSKKKKVNIKMNFLFSHLLQMFNIYKIIFKDKVFLMFSLAGVFILSLEMQLENYIGIRISSNVENDAFFLWEIDGFQLLGLLKSENTILVLILSPLLMNFFKYAKRKYLLIISCLIFTLAYSALSYSLNIPILFILMFFITFSEVIWVPITQTYLAHLPPQDLRGSYLAFSSSFKHNMALLISSITVYLSSYVEPLFITLFILTIGMSGVIIYIKILNNLDNLN
ncbi:MFS transporter [Bacillus safensis]|uniref:MFS transporter n=1 Tax=Bacillus safensis TaxID=561879 RepID=UPI002EBD723D|nr:MFS transporter [Bacillus safensis]